MRPVVYGGPGSAWCPYKRRTFGHTGDSVMHKHGEEHVEEAARGWLPAHPEEMPQENCTLWVP